MSIHRREAWYWPFGQNKYNSLYPNPVPAVLLGFFFVPVPPFLDEGLVTCFAEVLDKLMYFIDLLHIELQVQYLRLVP